MFDAKQKPPGEIDQTAGLGTEEVIANAAIIPQTPPIRKNTNPAIPRQIRAASTIC